MSEDMKKEQQVTEEEEIQEEESQQTEEAGQPEDIPEQAEEAAQENEEVALLKKNLEEAEKKRDEYLALAQRAQADYQNFKRRNSATRTEAYDDGVRETISALLPVIDNLERAIAAAEAENGALVSGVQMTLRQMLEAMTRMGLEEVPALGTKFDPDIHNAVMRGTEDEGEPGDVLEVFQKGYRVKDRMIRYAMVKIVPEN